MKNNEGLIVIDGSEGEGGGQILRSSLALGAIPGRASPLAKTDPPRLARMIHPREG